jgi:hypothetical protein
MAGPHARPAFGLQRPLSFMICAALSLVTFIVPSVMVFSTFSPFRCS